MKLLKKIFSFFLFAGFIVAIVELIDKFFMHEETERIGLIIDMEPKKGKSGNEELENDDKEPDAMLDILEDMDKQERTKQIEKLSTKLHKGEEVKTGIKSANTEFSDRQERILQVLKKEKKIDTEILNKAIEDVSVRTIRRDLDKLEAQKVIKKIGKTKGAYYVSA